VLAGCPPLTPRGLRLRRSERANRKGPSAQQFILQSARKPLRLNAPILEYFTAKSLYRLTRNLTLNQRVQDSANLMLEDSLLRRPSDGGVAQHVRDDVGTKAGIGAYATDRLVRVQGRRFG
jgi:hypothetical protein